MERFYKMCVSSGRPCLCFVGEHYDDNPEQDVNLCCCIVREVYEDDGWRKVGNVFVSDAVEIFLSLVDKECGL